MSTLRQRIRRRAYREIWQAKSAATADRDTMCDTWANDHNISENVLANWCPWLKPDIMA